MTGFEPATSHSVNDNDLQIGPSEWASNRRPRLALYQTELHRSSVKEKKAARLGIEPRTYGFGVNDLQSAQVNGQVAVSRRNPLLYQLSYLAKGVKE